MGILKLDKKFCQSWHTSCQSAPNLKLTSGFLPHTQILISSLIRMRKKYTRVNILWCVNILRCVNQPVSKFKLRSHRFYHQEYFCM